MSAPLTFPTPNAPTPPARVPETDAERHARQLDHLREMGELGMGVARDAAAKATSPEPPNPEAPDPGLTFARATRAVRQAIALEIRVAAGDLSPVRHARPAGSPAPPSDPRRALLRQALHKAAKAEPNRAALRREIEEGIELELADDPEAEIAIGEMLANLSEKLGLSFDPSILPDHLLGLDPSPNLIRMAVRDGLKDSEPRPADTVGWQSTHHASTNDPSDSAPPEPHPFHIRE